MTDPLRLLCIFANPDDEILSMSSALAAQAPADGWQRTSASPWYGDAYDLEDFVVSTCYAHKREHCGQISVFGTSTGGEAWDGGCLEQDSAKGHERTEAEAGPNRNALALPFCTYYTSAKGEVILQRMIWITKPLGLPGVTSSAKSIDLRTTPCPSASRVLQSPRSRAD